MACAYCNLDMHGICSNVEEGDCCCEGKGFESPAANLFASPARVASTRGPGRPRKEIAEAVGEPSVRLPQEKPGEAMRDVLSTGRKRAAAILPSSELLLSTCEWANLKRAGGGVYPIVGCKGNPATDRHHGPDKSVLTNERYTNLHGICKICHNRWHTLNDPTYGNNGKHDRTDSGYPWLPLSPYMWFAHDGETLAEDGESDQFTSWWRMPPELRQQINGGRFVFTPLEPRKYTGPESASSEGDSNSASPSTGIEDSGS